MGFEPGATVGKWTLLNNLGKGGNGEVWKVRGPDSALAAMKISTKPKNSAFERFKAEVHINLNHADVPGVLPVLDHMVPESFDPENPPWFVMPLGKTFRRAVRYDFSEIVRGIAEVAETLTVLHSREVVHRDIKPENLLHYQGRAQVGDFGIADYPEKTPITRNNDQLGAYWTIAPEMERSPDTADGRKADVYSLAKTLWMLLANDKRSFGGQYLPGRRPMALSSFFARVPLLHMIEGLLAASTAHEPDERPDMATFARTLREWSEQAGDYRQVSLGDWGALQSYLFPVNVPQRAMWTRLEDMITVLNLLGRNAELNHMFAPDGGGLDLEEAKYSSEKDCIELRFKPGMVEVVKPRLLIFESFPGFSEWAYFRLETHTLFPSGVYEALLGDYEEVLELEPGKYLDRAIYDQGFLGYDEEGDEIPLPKGARVVTREFKGSYVVFAKASHYNDIDRYLGDHNRFNADSFRKEIEAVVDKYGQKIRDALARRKKAD
jgi:serine/threonine-protein kinase